MTWLVVVAAAWLGLGGATAVLMVRRGHDVTTWLALAVVLGPVTPLLGVGAVAAEVDARARIVDEGADQHGFVDLVAGVDGSREALAALVAAVELHRQELGRVVVAVVVPFDADDESERAGVLAGAREAVAPLQPRTVVLHGDPVTALQRYAAEEDLDLIVVGARGRGRSGTPLGSVATRLASGSAVPVLIGPGAAGRR